MFTWIRLLAVILALAGTIIPAGLATADHNDDLHSPNMRLAANSPNSGTTNSDIGFWGDLAVAGDYKGFRILDISNPEKPEVLSDVSCNGAQNDVNVWENLVFLSIDNSQDRRQCEGSVDGPNGFEGIRILDISRPRSPRFIKGIATDCGSHTQTLVPDLERNRVLLYISSFPGGYGPNPRCKIPHFKISVVSVPIDHPWNAHVISEPSIPNQACHDISVFLPLNLAAASCLTEGQIWDISDPLHPTVLHRIDHPSVAIWHSATFTWDGKYVFFGDEWLGGGGCASQEQQTGRLWAYEVANPKDPVSTFMIPRPQVGGGLCSVHNFITIPVAKYYLVAAAWYTGGTTVVDFTDIKKPREIAFYDAVESPGSSFAWSSYWYNGYIYANDITRGVDIFKFKSRKVSGAKVFDHLNAQTQEVMIPK